MQNSLFPKNGEPLELSYFTSGSIILYKCFKNTAGQYILKLNTSRLCDPQILLRGLYLRGTSANVYHRLWTGIFIVDFTYMLQARVNQNVCQNKMNKYIHIMVWTHSVPTVEYYVAIKGNELLLYNNLSNSYTQCWIKGTRHLLLHDSIHIKCKPRQN